LGDPIRLRLLMMIATHPSGEACVCDLTPGFTVSGPTISHHLKTLREAGLVTCDRRGTWVFYRAVTPTLRRLMEALHAGAAAGGNGGARPEVA
jgi:DNA-binding transcriptional ArsR family regulator